MRRAAIVTALSVLLVACGYEGTVQPTAKKVVGSIPSATTTAAPPGNPTAGKPVFAKTGCGGCHTFKPAGSTGKIGPDLDKLPQYAKQANQGSLEDFTRESIVNPSAYLQPGYSDLMPKNYGTALTAKQISDVVAFLTKSG
jgi:mono/diheme cytochrome c family protein